VYIYFFQASKLGNNFHIRRINSHFFAFAGSVLAIGAMHNGATTYKEQSRIHRD
jgi:hypothetical protein